MSRSICNPAMILTCVALSIGTTQSMASNKTSISQFKTEITGASSPDSIPELIKLSMFFARYQLDIRNDLAGQLSKADDQVLNALSVADEQYQVQDNESYNQSLIGLCAQRGALNIEQIAQRSEEIASDVEQVRLERFTTAINSLSQKGRATVNDFIGSSITPAIRTSKFDTVAWAKADPTAFASSFDTQCYVAMNGTFPADASGAIERLKSEIASNDEQSSDE